MTHSRSIPTRRSLAVWVTAALATPSVGASEIHSHPDARGKHRPSIHESGNGTPVVDITTPGADGVSHNVYRQLDVDKKGVVFNNGRTTSATALAGQIGANPALASGTADLILNEVRSATPSQLAGYLEIGGDPADLVVANPAGITCDGCGFINAERAMLTTGRPLFDGDRWTGLDVRGGRIRIEGEGMDASRTAEADLLARAVEINAGLWADRLEITTGTGRFDRSGTLTESLAANTPSPEWGIDTARLGGMYANKIRLVANEHGVGVRNAGTIAAGEAGLAVTVDGKLVNHGTATTAGNARLQADRITNTGEIHVQADLGLDVGGMLDNRAGRITGQADVTANAAALDNRDGAILAGEALTLTLATGLENKAGLVFGQDELQLATSTMSGDGQWLSDGDIGITIGSDHQQRGEVVAGKDLSLQVDGQLTNHGRLAATGAADVEAMTIANLASAEMVAGTLTVTADDHLRNRGLIDGGEVDLAATTIDNTPGARIYGDLLSVTAHALRNLGDDASAATLAARDRLELGVDHTENRNGALILSAGDMQLAGRHEATADHLLNENASIEAFGDLSITADRIDNLNAGVVTTQVDEPPVRESWIQLRGSQRTFDAADCSNLYHENVWCQGYPHEISDFTWFQATAVTSHTEVVESRPATLQAGGNMSLEGGTLRNVDSQIIAGDKLQADLDHLDNHATQGQDITRREGTARFTTVESCGLFGSDHCREWHGTSPYRPAPEYGTPYDLPTVTFTGQADPDPSAPTIPGIAEADPSTSPALPSASLFRLTADNPNAPLIETDPRFTAYRQWYGSEAMLEALARDPAHTQKRLGDGFYEQALVRQQVIEQTGQRRLDGFADDDAQFRALIDAGIAFGRDLDLTPGVRLTAEQLARLTTDIVWLESETVTTGGEPTRVLVPRLHLADGATRQPGTSGLIAAKELDLSVAGTAVNRGTLAASDALTLAADRIENLGGSITAASTRLAAATDIHQRGGEIRGDHTLSLSAARDIVVEADTRLGESRAGASLFSRDQLVDRGQLRVNGDGEMTVKAGRDLTLQAAQVTHTGDGATRLAAGRNLLLQATSVGQDEQITWDADNRLVQDTRRDIGTTIDTQGDIDLLASRDIAIRAGEIDSQSGQVALAAGNDIRLLAGRATSHWEEAHRIESGGLLSGKVSTRIDSTTTDRSSAASLGGERVNVTAGRDVTVTGSQVISDRGTRFEAGRNIELLADRDEQTRHHFDETTRSGLFSNGGLSVTYGTQRLTRENDLGQTSTTPTQVASINGDVELRAGDTFRQVGSDMLAPGGDIDIEAGRVEIVEGRDASSSTHLREMEQSGLTLAVTSPVIETGARLQNLARATEDTDDSRMKRLAIASAGLAGFDSYSQIKSGLAKADASVAERAGGIGINISVGQSKSRHTAKRRADVARGSRITARGDIHIRAADQGDESDILVRGSDIHAAANTTLAADDEIALLAAESRREEGSQNDSQSASIGVGINVSGDSVGFSITASAARGEGETHARELTHQLSRVTAGQTASLQSGGDTSLVGAVVSGNAVAARVGGDLHIESVQDRMTYRSEQENESIGVSIPIGGAGFSASYSSDKSEATGNYRSVTEQSAIRAGSGGFDLTIDDNTSLVGSVITSDGDPSHNQLVTGTLTTSDLRNTSSASAEASGISLSSEMVTQGKYGVTKGIVANTSLGADRDGESQGYSRSAIAEGNVIITDSQAQLERTGATADQAVASLDRNTTGTHKAAVRQDAEAMRRTVEAERTIKKAIHAEAVKFTDESYRTMFLREHPMYQVVTDENGKPRTDPETGKPVLRRLSEEEKRNLKAGPDGKVAVFTNGIFNDETAATRYSAQMSEVPAGQPIYVIHFPEANNGLSEMLVAGYQKFMENDFWGLANATQQTRDVMAQYGNDGLYLSAHSRGAMTIGNAITSLSRDNSLTDKLTDTRFRLVGPAYNANQFATKVDAINGDSPTRVELQNHADDFVGSFIGGNQATYDKRPEDSSRLSEWARMFDEAPTVHSCYGNMAVNSKGCFDNYGPPETIHVKPNQE
ncbi:hemagglutinin repeat-containing protein [Guyparkeria hydrothermalis]|uniref:hemagglutinin repeat-containing protein n=1 Tax=Guyparkeria hydrothermalis TaxID=923 RepID=UPI00201FECDB|nr:hemagglutinin repeat-containing protein [Guyparkeria hydrothermalis]MCL7750735.1 hemagglutinin repeat-containing protein [Guyparkeria hydrothermalis]